MARISKWEKFLKSIAISGSGSRQKPCGCLNLKQNHSPGRCQTYHRPSDSCYDPDGDL